MKIVILGGGHVGYEVAKQLSLEEHDISVVENNREAFKKISSTLDVKPIFGNALDVNILKEAELDEANFIIAVTSSDEVNLVACQIANFMFKVETKVARLSNKLYFANYELFTKNRFNINLIVSPEIEISSVIRRGISSYGPLDVIPCIDDKLRIVGIECSKKSAFVDIPIRFVQNVSDNIQFAILFLERDNVSFIPRKNDVIKEGDIVYLVVKKEDLKAIMELCGSINYNSTRVVLIGGGVVTQEIANSITKEDSSVNIKIIEKNLEKAEMLSETLHDIEVLHGDSLDYEVMNEALLEDTNIVIATTNDDRVNILSCLLAKKYGAKRIAAMINNVTNIPILRTFGINTILDSRKVIVSKILHYIKNGSIDNIFTFAGESLEMLSVDIVENSRGIGVITDDLCLKDEIFVAALVRGDKVYINPSRMVINASDKILLVVKKDIVYKVTALLREKPKYLSE